MHGLIRAERSTPAILTEAAAAAAGWWEIYGMFFTVKHEYAHILFGTLFLTELEDGKLKIGFSDLFFLSFAKKDNGDLRMENTYST